jgi:hypothetical protein
MVLYLTVAENLHFFHRFMISLCVTRSGMVCTVHLLLSCDQTRGGGGEKGVANDSYGEMRGASRDWHEGYDAFKVEVKEIGKFFMDFIRLA